MIDLKKELEDYYKLHKYQIHYVDNAFVVKNKDIRTLYNLIAKKYPKTKEQIINLSKYIQNISGKALEDYNNCLVIISIYENYGINEKDWFVHWLYYHKLQHIRHIEYKKMNDLPRQDNKTYINCGNHDSNANKIRYPRKKRKTAWKRFYKLFPHLKKDQN